MVNHLDRIPVLMPREEAPCPEAGGTVRPIFIGLTPGAKGWSYFTDAWHPMISKVHGANYAHHNMDGIYYNGGRRCSLAALFLTGDHVNRLIPVNSRATFQANCDP